LLGQVALEERFKGKREQSLLVHTHGKIAANRLLLLGCGARKEFSAALTRDLAAKATRAANRVGAKSVALLLPPGDGVGAERIAESATEGPLVGGCVFDRCLSEDRRSKSQLVEARFVIAGGDAARAALARRAIGRGELVAQAICRARDLVNEPASYMTPSRL